MPMLQDISALVLVAVAAGYLAWRGWGVLVRNRGGGCGGGCAACPGNASRQDEPGFVAIEDVRDSRDGTTDRRF